MNIGFDIDDTIADISVQMLHYANIFHKDVLKKEQEMKTKNDIQNRYYLKALFGWNDEEKFKFFDMYYKNVLEEAKVKDGVSKTVKILREKGHIVSFITARITNVKGVEAENITKKWMQENDIEYDNLIIGASEKLPICKELGIELFVDDSFVTCKELQENGIKSFLINTELNKNVDNENIERIDSIEEIIDYLELKI